MGYRRRPGSEGHSERGDCTEATVTLTHAHQPRLLLAFTVYYTVIIIFLKQPGRRLTLGSSVRRLYHTTDAQLPGSWHTLEMTTNGREVVWKDWHTL